MKERLIAGYTCSLMFYDKMEKGTVMSSFLLLQQEKNRINKEGELVISSTKYRTQYKNLEDAIQKVEMIIDEASFVPKETSPEKKIHVQKL